MKYFATNEGIVRAISKGALVWQKVSFKMDNFPKFEAWLDSLREMNLDNEMDYTIIRDKIVKFQPGISPVTLDEFKEDCELAKVPFTEESYDEVRYEDRTAGMYKFTLDEDLVIDQIFKCILPSTPHLRSSWRPLPPKSPLIKTFLNHADEIAAHKPFLHYRVTG